MGSGHYLNLRVALGVLIFVKLYQAAGQVIVSYVLLRWFTLIIKGKFGNITIRPSVAIPSSTDENRLYITLAKCCLAVMPVPAELQDGLDQHASITKEEKERLLNFISVARKEYDELAKKEIQKAFVYSYEESARVLFDNYLDNVEAYCNGVKIKDPVTDEEMEPDEKLMRSIEEQIGVSENAKKSFREEILIRLSSYARKNRKFDYRSHEQLRDAVERKLFTDLKDVVKITTSTKTPDAEQLKRLNEVSAKLIDEYCYCPICANELMKYVGSLLNR